MTRALNGLTFRLTDNDAGHAATDTLMCFSAHTDPHRATYQGANIACGQAIEHNGQMLYHALDKDGVLSAGRAHVTVEETDSGLVLRLDWHWLTGAGQGVSRWIQVDR